MIGKFLADSALNGSLGGEQAAAILGLIAGFIVIIFVLAIAMWIYTSLAFMAIAKKAKQSSPGLAWIPGIGPNIIAFRAAQMHWWPWLLIIGFFIPFLNILATIAFTVFSVIWQWKLFEKIDKPGYWSILCLIPIVNLILYGIAAWGK